MCQVSFDVLHCHRTGGTVSGIIVYRSSYGSTKQYAEWIHDETGFPVFESRDDSIPWDADTVVIGCPIIANKPTLLGWMQKHWHQLKRKNVILFTTSGADPATEPVKEWIDKALPATMKDHVAVFPLAGRFEFAKLGRMHKAMMRLGAILLRSEEIKNQIKNPIDGVARENLTTLLQHLRES